MYNIIGRGNLLQPTGSMLDVCCISSTVLPFIAYYDAAVIYDQVCHHSTTQYTIISLHLPLLILVQYVVWYKG